MSPGAGSVIVALALTHLLGCSAAPPPPRAAATPAPAPLESAIAAKPHHETHHAELASQPPARRDEPLASMASIDCDPSSADGGPLFCEMDGGTY